MQLSLLEVCRMYSFCVFWSASSGLIHGETALNEFSDINCAHTLFASFWSICYPWWKHVTDFQNTIHHHTERVLHLNAQRSIVCQRERSYTEVSQSRHIFRTWPETPRSSFLIAAVLLNARTRSVWTTPFSRVFSLCGFLHMEVLLFWKYKN